MKKEEILQKIGLTQNEAKIYLALLKLGSSLVSDIVKETKITRTHIYDRLNKLLEKGAVSYMIQGGKKYFNAASPGKILNELDERRNAFKNMLPELLSLHKKQEDIQIEVYKGKEGLKTILQYCLKEKKSIFILGFRGAVARQVQFFYPHFQKQRIKLGIERKILADYDMKDSPLLQEKLTTYRLIPKGYHSPSGMWIYGNKTIIFLPTEELYMILIKSKEVTKLYRNYFDILWNVTKS